MQNRYLFFTGILLLISFEIARVYFIMPMPGSQKMNSLDLAFFFHTYRWVFRAAAVVLIFAGIKQAFSLNRILSALLTLLGIFICWAFNFKMSADSMFHQPEKLQYQNSISNKVNPERLVLGYYFNGEAKAWPIQFIAYHHQIRDTVGGKPIMVTYCSVCRTGRVFDPVINGKSETFRLVGMDHFNAMFEDESTHSWWRQVNGECVAGKRKGERLNELLCSQVTLRDWLSMHPDSKIMQPDPKFQHEYDDLKGYDEGSMKSSLEGTDTGSWQEKSWVLGVVVGNRSKAYDWNKLKKQRVLLDSFNGKHLIMWISQDNRSHFVWAFPSDRPYKKTSWLVSQDNSLSGWEWLNLSTNGILRDIAGQRQIQFEPVQYYQEFWHSWRTFHPETERGN